MAMRTRLKLTVHKTREPVYYQLRYWYLHDLTQLRAKTRVHGTPVEQAKRKLQKELVKIRMSY